MHDLSGNQVDQLFSILCGQFKDKDIPTVEDLVDLIKSSSISPPHVEELEFTWNFKKIYELIRTGNLEKHSYPHAFHFVKEDVYTRFRYKSFPQDLIYTPAAGLKLIKDGATIPPLSPSTFNIPDMNLDLIEADYRKYITSLKDESLRNKCSKSWERRRTWLEKLPRRINTMRKFDIELLPKQISPKSIYEFEDETELEPRELKGVEAYPEVLGALKKGDNIVVYSKDLVSRPWIGKVLDVDIENEEKCEVHWFKKKSKTNYVASFNVNRTPIKDTIDRSTIMFINISSTSTDLHLKITPTMLKKINAEYESLDSASLES